jgi:hypothetical protein
MTFFMNTRWVSRFGDSDTAMPASEEIRACLMAGA